MKCDKCGKKITSKYWIRTKGYPNPSYAGFSKLCYECGLEIKKHRNAYDWILKKLKQKLRQK